MENLNIEEIDFDKKGWIKKLLDSRLNLFLQSSDNDIREVISVSLLGYQTGLIYGHPLNLLFTGDINEMYLHERLKVIYLDLSLSIYISSKKTKLSIDNLQTFKDTFIYELNKYLSIFSTKRGLEISKSIYNKTEKTINQRLEIKAEWYDRFWDAFYYNALLFADMIFWNEYLEGQSIEKIQISRNDFNLLFFWMIKEQHENSNSINSANFNFLAEKMKLNKNLKNNQSFQSVKNLVQEVKLGKVEKRLLAGIYMLGELALKGSQDFNPKIDQHIATKLNISNFEFESYKNEAIGFIMTNLKRMRYIQNKVQYLDLINISVISLNILCNEHKVKLIEGIQINDLIKNTLNKRKYIELNWTEKDIIQKEILKLLFQFTSIELTSPNLQTAALVNITKIIPTDMLFEGIDNAMEKKRSKSTISE
jgi:hypothetical protein